MTDEFKKRFNTYANERNMKDLYKEEIQSDSKETNTIDPAERLKYILTTNDFELIYTYVEALVGFIIVLGGTWCFTMRVYFEKYESLVIIAWLILIMSLLVLKSAIEKSMVISSTKHANKLVYLIIEKSKFDVSNAVTIWMMWILYGILIKLADDIYIKFSYINESIALVIVGVSYIKLVRTNYTYIHLLIIVYVILLFVPHKDAVYSELHYSILLTKVTLFYLYYIIHTVVNYLSMSRGEHIPPYGGLTQEQATILSHLELKIIRSAWILLINKWLLFFALVQIILDIWIIVNNYEIYIEKDIENQIEPDIKETVISTPILNTKQNEPQTPKNNYIKTQSQNSVTQLQTPINQNTSTYINTNNNNTISQRSNQNVTTEQTPTYNIHTNYKAPVVPRVNRPMFTKEQLSIIKVTKPKFETKLNTAEIRNTLNIAMLNKLNEGASNVTKSNNRTDNSQLTQEQIVDNNTIKIQKDDGTGEVEGEDDSNDDSDETDDESDE